MSVATQEAALPAVRLLRRRDVDACLDGADVLGAVRAAIVAFARGEVPSPGSLAFDFEGQGEVHVKGAHIAGAETWTVKLASGFYGNAARGLPTASGLSFVSSAETGVPVAIILDGGYLTDVRTAVAGSLAVGALAVEGVEQVGIVGCGIQARIQLEHLVGQRRPRRVIAYGRDRAKADRYAEEMSARLGLEVSGTDRVHDAVAGSQVVLTATPAQHYLVEAEWLEREATIVAVGADMPGKQELEPAVLETASLLVADDPAQAARAGELQHLRSGGEAVRPLGEFLAERAPRPDGVVVVDLTGLGAEDAGIASLVNERASQLGLGELIDLG